MKLLSLADKLLINIFLKPKDIEEECF